MHIITPEQWSWLNRFGHMVAIDPPWIMSTDGRRGCFIRSETLLGEPVEWLNISSPCVVTPDMDLMPHGLTLDWQRVLRRFDRGQWETDVDGWLIRRYITKGDGWESRNVLKKRGDIHLSILEGDYA